MITLVRKIFIHLILASAVLTLVACGKAPDSAGSHTSSDEATQETTRDIENTTGFRSFDNHNYSVDGDGDRAAIARQKLLQGKDGNDPEMAEFARNNEALAASIQQVQIHRLNTKGEVTRKGRHSFRVEILSSLEETQLAPLVFEGRFRQRNNLLYIDKTNSPEHGKTFELSGVFQDLDRQGKVYGRFFLKVFHEDGRFKATSEILTRSYEASAKVRTPIDYEPSPSLDTQVNSLKGSQAWVSNVIVVLGRSFFNYELLPKDHPGNGIEDTSTPLLKIQGESLQTSSFVTKPTEVDSGDNSEVRPERVALFGADDDGLRSFQVDLSHGSNQTQDVMIEFREKGEVAPESLAKEVAEPVPVNISPDHNINDKNDEPESSPSTKDPQETDLQEESSNTIEDTDTAKDSVDLAPETSHTLPSDFSSGEPNEEPKGEEENIEKDNSEKKPGMWNRTWNYVFGPKSDNKDNEGETSKDPTTETEDETALDLKPDSEKNSAPEPQADQTNNPQEAAQPSDSEGATGLKPQARPDDLNSSDNDLTTSLKPQARPTENWPPATQLKEKPSRHLPDLEITGIHFGLSEDAFLSINYDEQRLPRVAQGLHDMEKHYGYKDIRENWIPHMRDRKGSLIRNFWRHGHPVKDLISQVFEAYDVLPTLAYVTILESTFLRSGKFEIQLTSAGHGTAYGPFQLLKKTASGLGLLTDMSQRLGHKPASWDERNWFVPSLCGAAKHFKKSLNYYGHADTTWAILAYHAGDYGATKEIAASLNVNAKAFWNKLRRYSYTYQEIKAMNKLTNAYEEYVDKKLASYFILQSPNTMKFNVPRDIKADIPDGHKHKFFPSQAIKDKTCENASRNWRAYFNRQLP